MCQLQIEIRNRVQGRTLAAGGLLGDQLETKSISPEAGWKHSLSRSVMHSWILRQKEVGVFGRCEASRKVRRRPFQRAMYDVT